MNKFSQNIGFSFIIGMIPMPWSNWSAGEDVPDGTLDEVTVAAVTDNNEDDDVDDDDDDGSNCKECEKKLNPAGDAGLADSKGDVEEEVDDGVDDATIDVRGLMGL